MFPSTHFQQVYGCSNVYNGLGRDGVDGDKLNPSTITAYRHAIKEPFFPATQSHHPDTSDCSQPIASSESRRWLRQQTMSANDFSIIVMATSSMTMENPPCQHGSQSGPDASPRVVAAVREPCSRSAIKAAISSRRRLSTTRRRNCKSVI